MTGLEAYGGWICTWTFLIWEYNLCLHSKPFGGVTTNSEEEFVEDAERGEDYT